MTKPKITGGAPILLVQDVVASANHYRDKMGFSYDRFDRNRRETVKNPYQNRTEVSRSHSHRFVLRFGGVRDPEGHIQGGVLMVDRPQLLLVSIVLLPIVLILWRRYTKGHHDLESLSGSWLRIDYANVYLVKAFFTSLFFGLFVLLSVTAAAGFRLFWVRSWRRSFLAVVAGIGRRMTISRWSSR